MRAHHSKNDHTLCKFLDTANQWRIDKYLRSYIYNEKEGHSVPFKQHNYERTHIQSNKKREGKKAHISLSMRGFHWVLLCAIFYVKTRNSFAVVEFFENCADNQDCPDNAECVTIGTDSKCRCRAGYDAIDLPFTVAGTRATVCKGILL